MKNINRLLSCFLLTIIFFTSVFSNVNAQTLENYDKKYEFSENTQSISEEEIFRKDNYKITFEYSKNDGKTTLRGYLNDKLVDESYFFDDDREHIHNRTYVEQKDFDVQRMNNISMNTEKVSNVNDIISVNKYTSNNYSSFSSGNYLGKIKVKLNSGGEWIFSISENLGEVRYDRYTVNDYTGPLVELATAIISAMKLPSSMVAEFAGGFLAKVVVSVGVGIVSGIIVDSFSTTLEAEVQDIIINAKSSMFGSRNIITGKKAHITAKSSPKYYGETFYDGIDHKYWGTETFARMIIKHHFGFNYVNDYSYEYM